MREIRTPADIDAYFHETWSGDHGGPVVTLGALLTRGGYFEAPHLVLVYSDFLAGLASGRGRESEPTALCKFIRQYFPSPYRSVAPWLVLQYRHGLVHEYAPKSIDLENGRLVGWRISLGDDERGTHLQFIAGQRAGQWHFHLNADQLLDDFRLAVRLFRHDAVHEVQASEQFLLGMASYRAPHKLSALDRYKAFIGEPEKQWLLAQTQ